MLSEVLESLAVERGGVYVDCTMGGAGHSAAILEQLPWGSLVAIDRDLDAVLAGSERLKAVEKRAETNYFVVHSDYAELGRILSEYKLNKIDGLIADLGVSSVQLDRAERGFSYRQAGPLDMRMDVSQTLTAADVVNTYAEEELIKIFTSYGEERYAKRVAANICRRRQERPFSTTTELSEVIERSLPSHSRREKHPAKRCFQALRIEVNGELKQLENLLAQIPSIVNRQARICFLTFHSLEDRIVKQTFRSWENPCNCPKNMPCVCGAKPLGKIVNRKGMVASKSELQQNRRSHSARLRCFEFGENEDE